MPFAICTPDPSDQGAAWVILVLVVTAYFAVLYLTFRKSGQGAWLHLAGTWLLAAATVTILLLWLDQAGASHTARFITAVGAVIVIAAIGAIGRRGDGIWRYATASAVGGITPIAFVVAALASIYATGGCLD